MSQDQAGRLTVLYHKDVVRRDIKRLDHSTALRIRKAIESRLTAYPERYAKPLAYTRNDLWTLRVGDWRIVFCLRGEEILILRIGHRSE